VVEQRKWCLCTVGTCGQIVHKSFFLVVPHQILFRNEISLVPSNEVLNPHVFIGAGPIPHPFQKAVDQVRSAAMTRRLLVCERPGFLQGATQA